MGVCALIDFIRPEDELLQVWDLSYNIHSHEIEDLPQLVTASNPLCDQSRLPGHGAHATLYELVY